MGQTISPSSSGARAPVCSGPLLLLLASGTVVVVAVAVVRSALRWAAVRCGVQVHPQRGAELLSPWSSTGAEQRSNHDPVGLQSTADHVLEGSLRSVPLSRAGRSVCPQQSRKAILIHFQAVLHQLIHELLDLPPVALLGMQVSHRTIRHHVRPDPHCLHVLEMPHSSSLVPTLHAGIDEGGVGHHIGLNAGLAHLLHSLLGASSIPALSAGVDD
mmetsp:Transcript_56321/g.123362  ORF Transcript_56321/g.123362 Transcript_56321/m.123362 type:complete len:215 (+) Transcript_56321:161-805(+)